MLKIDFTKKFKKDFKHVISRGWNESHFEEVVSMLQNEIPLPPKYRDHSLVGEYKSCRECHIEPDWLLVYTIDKGKLTLILSRTGSHSDLF